MAWGLNVCFHCLPLLVLALFMVSRFDKFTETYFKFMTAGYRNEDKSLMGRLAYGWESLTMFFKIFITSISVKFVTIFTDARVQIGASLILICVMLWMQRRLAPWASKELNHLESAVLMATAAVALSVRSRLSSLLSPGLCVSPRETNAFDAMSLLFVAYTGCTFASYLGPAVMAASQAGPRRGDVDKLSLTREDPDSAPRRSSFEITNPMRHPAGQGSSKN